MEVPVKVVIDPERCKGCGLCLSVCLREVLTRSVTRNGKGYYPASVGAGGRCIACVSCARICPDSAIVIWKEEEAS